MKFLLFFTCLSASLLTVTLAFEDDEVQTINLNQIRGVLPTYEKGVYKFSDWTLEDFFDMKTGYVPPLRDENDKILGAIEAPKKRMRKAPENFDWRIKGAVSAVKNQLTCGSCWAFTAIAAIESHNFIKTRNMVLLSEQNLVDCFKKDCKGSATSKAFQYIKKQRGVSTERSYPYVANKTINYACKFSRRNVGAALKGFVSLPADEEVIKEAVYNFGPVATGLFADEDKFGSYKSGIFNDANSTQPNHAVLIVGYGVEDGVNFWIVKNSWGEEWGEAGYFRIVRGQNMRGIASVATYPLMA